MLDLLFHHRILKGLVAVELKIVVFKAAFKGQMLGLLLFNLSGKAHH